MATATQIADLRKMVNEPTTAVYDDAALGLVIDESANINAAAATIWMQKASRFAELVDVKEGSSSRSLGDLYEQALSMAKSFTEYASTPQDGAPRRSRTRAIERP